MGDADGGDRGVILADVGDQELSVRAHQDPKRPFSWPPTRPFSGPKVLSEELYAFSWYCYPHIASHIWMCNKVINKVLFRKWVLCCVWFAICMFNKMLFQMCWCLIAYYKSTVKCCFIVWKLWNVFCCIMKITSTVQYQKRPWALMKLITLQSCKWLEITTYHVRCKWYFPTSWNVSRGNFSLF